MLLGKYRCRNRRRSLATSTRTRLQLSRTLPISATEKLHWPSTSSPSPSCRSAAKVGACPLRLSRSALRGRGSYLLGRLDGRTRNEDISMSEHQHQSRTVRADLAYGALIGTKARCAQAVVHGSAPLIGLVRGALLCSRAEDGVCPFIYSNHRRVATEVFSLAVWAQADP